MRGRTGLVAIVAVALLLRVMPHWIWGFGFPVRDEAQYRNLAEGIVAGHGLLSPQGWLWAPGYPYTIAVFRALLPPPTSTLPVFQAVVGALACLLVFELGRRAASERAGLVAAGLYAVHPTLIYFSTRMWSEAVYGPLLLATVLATLQARERPERGSILAGVLLGICVLYRGVATWTFPFFVAALLWPEPDEGWREAAQRRARHAMVLLIAMGVVIAPWSLATSARYRAFVVSDASVGQSFYLGNNDFRPFTFDFGNGIVNDRPRSESTRHGRAQCTNDNPALWNQCEIDRGMGWITAHPGEFLARMPHKTAQLLNPHSFLTRALRAGKYVGMPFWLKESLIAWVAVFSFAVIGGGTLGAAARGRGALGVLVWSLALYSVAASAALYGLTRFRVPVEGLWVIYLGVLLAHPVATVEALRDPRRAAVAAVMTLLVLGHMLVFLPAGWPGFHW